MYEVLKAVGCLILMVILFYYLIENKDKKNNYPNTN